MISVVMGVHRYDGFLELSIDSILSQTMTDLELIIVANGVCADDIIKKIRLNYPDDQRLKFEKSQISQLSHALNVGIDKSSFEYIARMDSDDVAWPDRLERQLAFLRENDLDMVGCDLRLVDGAGAEIGFRRYPKGPAINRQLSYRNCFAHNTVLYKKKLILEARGYNAGFNSEDYDLWLRLRRMRVKWDNMEETLLDYRIHGESSQRKLLGYAEATGLAMREFVLKKSFKNFAAIPYHLIKSIVRSRR